MENHHFIAGSIHYFDWAIFNSFLYVETRPGRHHKPMPWWPKCCLALGWWPHVAMGWWQGNHPQIAELLIYEYRLLIDKWNMIVKYGIIPWLVKYDKLPRLISISIVLRLNSHLNRISLDYLHQYPLQFWGGSQNRVSPKSWLFHDWMIWDSPHIFIYTVYT